MNRPNYSEYTFEHILIRDSVYVEDLEIYCDKLEKALDSAIDVIIKRGCEYCTEIECNQRWDECDKSIWKEFLLKDE